MNRLTADGELLAVTALMPEDASQPVVIYDETIALKFAIVEREFVQNLSEEWNSPGLYVLLDSVAPDGSWGCYVGKAPSGIRSRLLNHVRGKEHWRRALLIVRDTTFGFDSAQVAWLEGRVYELFDAAEDARLHNKTKPGDETLAPHTRVGLERVVVPVSRLLRLIGYDTSTADDNGVVRTTNKVTRSSRFHGITVAQIINAGLLEAGTALVSTNGVWPATATVNADGTIHYDGANYPTPSAAASRVKQGAPVNGWDFWAEESTRKTLAGFRSELVAPKPTSRDEIG